LKLKEKNDPYKIFLVALMMVTPNVYLLPIKLGGRSVGVPMPISEKKKITLGVKFVIKLLKERSVSLSVKLLVDLLISSVYGQGPAVERKIALYKAGNQNRHLLVKLFKRIKRIKRIKNKK